MEALPMVLIEAAAYGKPVVATNAGGIPEIVLDGVTGTLVPVRDADALRGALASMRNEEMRARMGAAALARWKELFARGQMANELERLYRSVLGR
jgi:glycosyltransferase involved in cell wall biosynthesis